MAAKLSPPSSGGSLWEPSQGSPSLDSFKTRGSNHSEELASFIEFDCKSCGSHKTCGWVGRGIDGWMDVM